MGFKYSYNTIVYSGEDYLTQVKRLNKFGYDKLPRIRNLYKIKNNFMKN